MARHAHRDALGRFVRRCRDYHQVGHKRCNLREPEADAFQRAHPIPSDPLVPDAETCDALAFRRAHPLFALACDRIASGQPMDQEYLDSPERQRLLTGRAFCAPLFEKD